MNAQPPRPSFELLARGTDETIDVALGAALIAKDVYVDLDVEALTSRLDDLAGPLGGGALAGLPLARQADAVSERFRELGFRGNVDDYYDVRNSLLPDVLDRRTGIPITMSLVWCEIARRAGVFARGVGFPGHFLARVDELPAISGRPPSAPVVVDPFDGGTVVTDAAARRLLRQTHGEVVEVDPALFEAATSRDTLVRMLTNLTAIWARRGEDTRAFVALDRILALRPDSAGFLRERGALALRLGLEELARQDFTRALELEPGAADAPLLQRRIEALSRSPRSAPN